MNNFEKLKSILDESGVSYRFIPVKSRNVDETVKELGIKYREGLSSLLFKDGKGNFYLILRRDDRNLDSGKIKKLLKVDSFEYSSEDDLKKLGLESGLLTPFVGRLSEVHVKIIIEQTVSSTNKVICGTTSADHSLEIDIKDLLKLIGEYEVLDISIPNPMRQDFNGTKRILSGITPSSTKGLHLGNYFGAVKPHIEFQSNGECFYFIANLHALNTVFNGREVEENTMNIFTEYLAFGIDPVKTSFYVQSDIHSIPYLQTILNNVVTIAELKRMHGYKDKLAKDVDQDAINVGLFSYPVLMAADILIFKPDIVPVGEDQTQHVEICREIARTFNNRYGEILKIPELYVKKEVARVKGIDGERKMGKSLGNDLPVFGTEEEIRSQVMKITTDPARIHPTDPGDPAKNVCFDYLRLMDFDTDNISTMEDKYRTGNIKDVEIKEMVFSTFMEYFKSFREKKVELLRNKDFIYELRKRGADKANAVADRVIGEVKGVVGV